MTAFVICVGSSLLSKTVHVTQSFPTKVAENDSEWPILPDL